MKLARLLSDSSTVVSEIASELLLGSSTIDGGNEIAYRVFWGELQRRKRSRAILRREARPRLAESRATAVSRGPAVSPVACLRGRRVSRGWMGRSGSGRCPGLSNRQRARLRSLESINTLTG